MCVFLIVFVCFFKQKTAYEMRISDWSSDVCSSDLAGVDCSDNEVNIKIALNREMAEGRLSQDDRDALLVRMTDNVSELVLEDNRLQALALSIAEKGGSAAVPSLVRIMETFEIGRAHV